MTYIANCLASFLPTLDIPNDAPPNRNRTFPVLYRVMLEILDVRNRTHRYITEERRVRY